MGSSSAQPLAGTEGGIEPFWSPDNQTVGFFADSKLKRIEASGGGLQILADGPLARGGTWNRDGVILYAPSATGGIYRVAATGGTVQPVTTLDSVKHEDSHRWPCFLADGRHYVFLARSASIATGAAQVYGGSLDSKDRVLVVESGGRPAYASGRLLFVRGSNLMAQSFDEGSLRLSGDPTPIAE